MPAVSPTMRPVAFLTTAAVALVITEDAALVTTKDVASPMAKARRVSVVVIQYVLTTDGSRRITLANNLSVFP